MATNGSVVAFPTVGDQDRYTDINVYAMGVIIFAGLILNTFSLAVFIIAGKFRKKTTTHFLICLTLADLLYLLGDTLRWLNSSNSHGLYFGLTFMHTSAIMCPVIYYIRYTAQIMCSWITLAIAAERFISVKFPLRVGTICTLRVARVTIVAIVVAALAVGAFPFWSVSLYKYGTKTYCSVTSKHTYQSWMMSLRVGCYALPVLVMVTITCLICRAIVIARQQRMSLSNTNQSTHPVAMERQLTAIMLAITTTFIVLRLPYILAYLVATEYTKCRTPTASWFCLDMFALVKVTDIFATANYSVNFFLFCLSGSMFRQQLRRMMHGGSERSSTSMSNTVTRPSRVTATDNKNNTTVNIGKNSPREQTHLTKATEQLP